MRLFKMSDYNYNFTRRLSLVAVVSMAFVMLYHVSTKSSHVYTIQENISEHNLSTKTAQLGQPKQSTNRKNQTRQSTTGAAATPNKALDYSYKDLPKITIVIRTCNRPKFVKEFYCMFLRSAALFWPGSYGGMSLVLDKESKQDPIWGDKIKKQMKENFPEFPISVHYEPLPSDTNLLKNPSRSVGYNRQLWSTFFADLYTDSPIIAYMDTDTQFVTPMTKEYVYNGGKLKVFGEGGRQGWVKSWEGATLKALGLPQVANFMITFPQLLHKDTVSNTRKFIMKHLNTSTFEETFAKFYSHGVTLSPVNVWMTYAWFHEHDRYEWHIKATTAKLQENNDILPEGHKIGPQHIVPSIIGVGHISDQKVFKPELMLPGYCMSLKAAGKPVPSGCKDVTHNMALLCDYWESFFRYPWPAADKWCPAGKMDKCCHTAMVDHYKDVTVLAKEKSLTFSKDNVYKVDKLATEMGVTCPKIDLP